MEILFTPSTERRLKGLKNAMLELDCFAAVTVYVSKSLLVGKNKQKWKMELVSRYV